MRDSGRFEGKKEREREREREKGGRSINTYPVISEIVVGNDRRKDGLLVC
jgi:hypothetical protein